MKRLIKNGKVFLEGAFQKADVLFDRDIIQAGETVECRGAEIYDAQGSYVVPGFIDIHTHGAAGVDVNSASRDGYEKISRFFASQGTTSWCCSILTDTKEQTLWCIGEFLKFKKEHNHCADMAGIHLEGPFLAKEFKGAMPEQLLRKADISLIEEYQQAAEGNIRYITVSPEVEGVWQMIRPLRELGITVAIGHSGASYETSWKCIEEGAMAATHLLNAMKLPHQHFPAISGAALESDIYCEAICDGRHLHPGMVRLLLKTKGIHRIAAITDSIMAAGMPDGRYKLGVNDIIVEDGDAKLLNGVRAGSTLTMQQALANLKKFTGYPLEKLILPFTENPARLLGLYDTIGSIQPGKRADLVVLDEKLSVRDTFVKGDPVTDLV